MATNWAWAMATVLMTATASRRAPAPVTWVRSEHVHTRGS